MRVAAAGAHRARVATSDAEQFARAGVVLAGDAGHAVAGRPEGAAFSDPDFLGTSLAVDLPIEPRPLGGLPQALVVAQYRLVTDPKGTRLTRAEAPLVGGRPGARGAVVTLWQGAPMEFRFLGPDGSWVPDWPRGPMPRAFALTDPGAESPVLIATLPDLLPAACTLGPGPDCPLAAQDFP